MSSEKEEAEEDSPFVNPSPLFLHEKGEGGRRNPAPVGNPDQKMDKLKMEILFSAPPSLARMNRNFLTVPFLKRRKMSS